VGDDGVEIPTRRWRERLLKRRESRTKKGEVGL